MGIVVFGAVFIDIKGYPDCQYIPAGRNVGHVTTVQGGVSRNVAEDIANVELAPTFITILDQSEMSDQVLAKLKRHRVDTRYIRRTGKSIGTWLAVFNNEGDVVASVSQRPDLGDLSAILDDEGEEIIKNADSVVVEIDIDAAILKKIFALADRYGKKVYAVVSNMSIAMERRDLLKRTGCIVCNVQEAGMLFSEDFEQYTDEELPAVLKDRVASADYARMIITLGERGSVYAEAGGEAGFCPAQKVAVIDTTGCGDAFFSGVAIGLTYGKPLAESCHIGTRLASSVIATKENVCPRFLPKELGLDIDPRTID